MRGKLGSVINLAFYITDIVTIVFSWLISWYLKTRFDSQFNTHYFSNYLFILIGILPFYLFIYYALDLYAMNLGKKFFADIGKVAQANVIGFISLMGLFYTLKLFYVSRAVILLFAVINIFFTIPLRYQVWNSLKFIRKKGFNRKYILQIGAGNLGTEFYHKLQGHPEYGYYLVGILDDDPAKLGTKIGDCEVVDAIDALERIFRERRIDEVVVALPMKAHQKMAYVIEICEKYGTKVMIVPDYYKYIPAKPKVVELEEMPLILIRDVPLDVFVNRLTKRSFDIVGSLVLIIIFSPLMLLVALGVKISSPGPVLFKQKRVGLNRVYFDMFKFRSMRVSDNEVAATTWTTEHDPRRTAFGEFIRKTSLDELPQFFNVLKGDMSLIGPRPERPYYVEKFKEEIPKYMIKHQVKPGITGWAQVNGWRGDTSIEERIKCDIYYIENWTFLLDLRILFMTAIRGFVNRNAY